MLKIGFLGGGNMACAIAGGLVAAGTSPDHITVMDRHPEKLAALHGSLGVNTRETLGEWVRDLDVVVLAVKPQGLKDSCLQAAAFINPASTILSIAAAVPAASIAGWLKTDRIVRAMPNTPAMVQKGCTGLYASAGAAPLDRERAQSVMQSVGTTEWVEAEEALHLVTAGPGAGPAYVFLFMEALAQALQDEGLAADKAKALALSTVEGAAALARQSGADFETLRLNVTSKGGTTAKAIEAFEAHDLRGAVKAAVKACAQRSRQMSELFA